LAETHLLALGLLRTRARKFGKAFLLFCALTAAGKSPSLMPFIMPRMSTFTGHPNTQGGFIAYQTTVGFICGFLEIVAQGDLFEILAPLFSILPGHLFTFKI
jgi:hypothetical protein